MLGNETKRLIYINDLFKKILSQKIQNTKNNFPEAQLPFIKFFNPSLITILAIFNDCCAKGLDTDSFNV